MSFPADYKGKLVLLDFWATWCGGCQAEIPHLVDAYEKYRDQGFEIVGVPLDDLRQTTPAKVARWAKDKNMQWAQVNGGQQIAAAYGVYAIPAAFLIDGDTGQILAAGDAVRGDALLKTIAKNLNNGSSKATEPRT